MMPLWYMHLSMRMLSVIAGSLFALEVLHRSGMQFYEVSHTCMLPSWGLSKAAVAAAVTITPTVIQACNQRCISSLLGLSFGQHC